MNTKSKSAASSKKKAGKRHSVPGLASAWLSYCRDPECREVCGHFAIKLDALLKSRVPDGLYQGILKGLEDEVRQEAYLLLVGKYLAGNSDLIAATAAGSRKEITNQITKSLCGSIRSVRQTMKRLRWRYLELHPCGVDLDTCPQVICEHPAQRTSLWVLPFELQRQMVFASLQNAIQEKLLVARSARIAMTMVDEGLTQSDIAKSLGISRPAVHQMLAPVRDYLKRDIETREFP